MLLSKFELELASRKRSPFNRVVFREHAIIPFEVSKITYEVIQNHCRSE